MQAQWNGQVIATSDDIVTVDGNAYFPLEALGTEVLDQLLDQHVLHGFFIEGIGGQRLQKASDFGRHDIRGIGDLENEHRRAVQHKR